MTKKATELLFGTKLKPVSVVALAKQTHIPESTLRMYKRNPGIIPLDRLRIIVKALGLSEEEVVKLVR
jgi:hypothetical protein